jgi:hypothetical protein
MPVGQLWSIAQECLTLCYNFDSLGNNIYIVKVY